MSAKEVPNLRFTSRRKRESNRIAREEKQHLVTKPELDLRIKQLTEMITVLQLEIIDLQHQHNCVVNEIKPSVAVTVGSWLNGLLGNVPYIGTMLALPGKVLHGTWKTAYNTITGTGLKRYDIKKI
jgi:hypothetical protein